MRLKLMSACILPKSNINHLVKSINSALESGGFYEVYCYYKTKNKPVKFLGHFVTKRELQKYWNDPDAYFIQFHWGRPEGR